VISRIPNGWLNRPAHGNSTKPYLIDYIVLVGHTKIPYTPIWSTHLWAFPNPTAKIGGKMHKGSNLLVDILATLGLLSFIAYAAIETEHLLEVRPGPQWLVIGGDLVLSLIAGVVIARIWRML
jgi:hypothetical protein